MTTAELVETLKRIKGRTAPQPEMMPVGDTLQGPIQTETTPSPVPIAPPASTGPPVLMPPPPQPAISEPVNPEATAIESKLSAMNQREPEPTLIGRLKGALEGFGRYGGMDPTQAQTLEAAERQTGVINRRNRQQDLYAQLKAIQDRDRQATMDARQRAIDEREAALDPLRMRTAEAQATTAERAAIEPARIDPLSREGVAAQQELRPPQPQRNIDPNSREGIEARLRFEREKPPTVSTAQPDYEWVTRNGKPIQIRKGTAQPGDKPYDGTAARQAGDGGESPYSQERAKRTIQSVDELMPKVTNWTIGAGSLLSGVPTSDALNFKTELDTLKANIAFNELTQMRAASKTGGALGQVSDRELTLLTAALGALDQRQSVDNFKAQLKKIRDSIERWQTAQAMQNAPGSNVTIKAPPIGTVEGGHIFQGGDPADPANWKKQ